MNKLFGIGSAVMLCVNLLATGLLEAQSASYLEHHKRGMEAFSRNETEKGFKELTLALEINPTSLNVRFDRGRAYAAMGKTDLAMADANHLIRQQPGYSGGYYCRAEAHYRSNSFGKAMLDINQCIKLDPGFAPSYATRGKIHFVLNRKEDALLDYAMALELDPEFDVAYYNRALLCLAMGRHHDAISDLIKVLNLKESDYQARLELAKTYFLTAQYEKTVVESNVVLRTRPDDARACGYAFGLRGDAALKLGDPEKAVADLSQAIALRPEDPSMRASRSQAYFKLGKFKEMLADTDAALKLDPKNRSFWETKSQALCVVEDGPNALVAAEELMKRFPKIPASYIVRAKALSECKRYKEALLDVNKALELQPDIWEALYVRSNIHRGMNNFDAAVVDLMKCIKIQPNDPTPRCLMAIIYMDRREYSTAWEHAMHAGELAGWKGGYELDVLARVATANGKFLDALKWQKQALASADFPPNCMVESKARLELLEKKVAETGN